MADNIFKKIAGFVGKAAPAVARGVLGPAGNAVVEGIKAALGMPQASDEELEQELAKNNPETLLKLREFEETTFRLIYEIDHKDRESARGLAQAKGILVQASLSAVFVIGYFVVAYAYFEQLFMEGSINTELLGQFGIVFGVISAGMIQIMNFWFGSSEGSRRKTDQQHELAKHGK